MKVQVILIDEAYAGTAQEAYPTAHPKAVGWLTKMITEYRKIISHDRVRASFFCTSSSARFCQAHSQRPLSLAPYPDSVLVTANLGFAVTRWPRWWHGRSGKPTGPTVKTSALPFPLFFWTTAPRLSDTRKSESPLDRQDEGHYLQRILVHPRGCRHQDQVPGRYRYWSPRYFDQGRQAHPDGHPDRKFIQETGRATGWTRGHRRNNGKWRNQRSRRGKQRSWSGRGRSLGGYQERKTRENKLK